MALIGCPDCGGRVSSRAAACPKCGRRITDGIGCPLVLAIAVAIIVAAVLLGFAAQLLISIEQSKKLDRDIQNLTGH